MPDLASRRARRLRWLLTDADGPRFLSPAIAPGAAAAALPWLTPRFFRAYGGRPSKLEPKSLLLVLFGLDGVATLGADLIVVGYRGRSPIRDLVFGSISRRIVAHAPCSMLVVRPR
jgi:hypothetical protein